MSAAVAGEAGTVEAGLDGFRAALVVPLGAALLGAGTVAWGLRRRSRTDAVSPPGARGRRPGETPDPAAAPVA